MEKLAFLFKNCSKERKTTKTKSGILYSKEPALTDKTKILAEGLRFYIKNMKTKILIVCYYSLVVINALRIILAEFELIIPCLVY